MAYPPLGGVQRALAASHTLLAVIRVPAVRLLNRSPTQDGRRSILWRLAEKLDRSFVVAPKNRTVSSTASNRAPIAGTVRAAPVSSQALLVCTPVLAGACFKQAQMLGSGASENPTNCQHSLY